MASRIKLHKDVSQLFKDQISPHFEEVAALLLEAANKAYNSMEEDDAKVYVQLLQDKLNTYSLLVKDAISDYEQKILKGR